MDAVEYIKNVKRMCKFYGETCDGCGLNVSDDLYCMEGKSPEECIATVEQWAKEHPVKTRQSEFLKHYPDARIDQNTGALDICPNKIFDSATGINCNVQPCFECEAKFWLAEAET